MLMMNLVVETLESGNVVASILEFPQHRVESHSREEAIAQIRANAMALRDRIEILPLVTLENDSQSTESHWLQYAGMFENDSDFAEIVAAIRAERDIDDDSEVDPSVYLR
jgi:hypothetical protein